MPLTLADGRDRITVFTTKPADLSAITTAEATAAIYASPMINKPDFKLGATGSDTVADQPLSQEGNAKTFGRSNFDGSTTVLRFLDAAGQPVALEDTLWDAMKTKGTLLWIAYRVGPKSSVAMTAGDKYEWFEVMTDAPQHPSDRAGYIKNVIPLGIQDAGTGVMAA